jgi:hypothetical protein
LLRNHWYRSSVPVAFAVSVTGTEVHEGPSGDAVIEVS